MRKKSIKDTFNHKKEKREKRLAKEKNKRRRRILIFVPFLAFFLTVSYLVYQSQLLTITKVEVKGNKHLDEGQILKAAAPPQRSSYFSFPTSQVKKRVSTLPWIKKVKVVKSLPGSVTIEVTERQPFAYITFVDVLYIVSMDGFVISAEPYKKFNLPVIENLNSEKVIIGRHISSDSFRNAVKAYTSFPKRLREKVYSLSCPNEDELTFIIGGIDIIYGVAEKPSIKNQVIEKLLKSKDKDLLSTIDVRVPNRPVVRLIGR